MATLFLDFENGNDDYGGTSFSLLASGTDGRISSSTFSSAGASFPNDGSLINQYLSIFNGTIYAVYNITAYVSSTSLTIAAISGGTALANQSVDRQYYIGGRWKNITTGATAVRTVPGDTIRIMGSPAPTSLGVNGTWTSGALQATKSITGATNATPISITCTAHGYSTGDTVVITSVGGNTNANGTWEITSTGTNTFTLDGSAGNANYTSGGTVRLRNNTRVKLASAVTQNIASTGPGRAAWTASANCLASFTGGGGTKEGAVADVITINTAFTTGKAAYWALPTTLDLSGYQQVSFWIEMRASGTVSPTPSAGQMELRLCSDAVGDTVVDTIPIPAIPTLQRWQMATVDNGSALGASIASISLYVNNDVSTSVNITFTLSNIIACKASSEPDSLTLTSLIGKNTTGETFWGIQSINGTRVMLDADTNALPTSATLRGYYGTSETVTTYKRETIKLGPAASNTTALQTIQESGTDGSPITYSGGWDRTAMSTQNLETWLDGVNGNGTAITGGSNISCISTSNIAVCRCTSSNGGTILYSSLGFIAANNNTNAIVTPANGFRNTFSFEHLAANSTAGISCSNPARNSFVIKKIVSNGTAITGVDGAIVSVQSASGQAIVGNNSTGLSVTSGLFRNLSIETGGATSATSADSYAEVYLYKCSTFTDPTLPNGVDSFINSQNHDNTADNHKIFLTGALISSATDQRKTASGISWKIQPTNVSRSSTWPVTLSLAKVACAANSLVTVKAWMRRSNTGLTMRLVCKGGQIAGVSSDVVSAMTAAADTWEEESITFTPTEVGVVEITAEAWGGTTYSGWVDDMTISQA